MRKLSRWLAPVAAMLFLVPLGSSPSFSGAPSFGVYTGNLGAGPVAFAADRVVVDFQPGVGAQSIHGIVRGVGARIDSIGYGGAFHVLAVGPGRVWNVVNALSSNPNVRYAHPDWIATAAFVPNDTFYSPYQWHLDNPDFGGIEAEQAWDLNLGGSAAIIVAVLDTGVAYETFGGFCQAPDLAGTNFVAGFDFISNDTHANDGNSHGTHVTGTIAQTTNNSLGVAGIAFNTSIMPVRVLDNGGSGPISVIANGIRFAADNGAHVINMSLGTNAPQVFLAALSDAVAYADSKGVLQFAATGNSGANKIDCPACYDQVVAVGATGYDDTLAYYSNKGNGIELTAPGGNDRTDMNNDGFPDMVLQNTFNPNTQDVCDFAYWFFEGTSMATPHAAGTAALLFAAGATSASQVRQLLRDTAKDKGAAGYDTTYGYGVVNAAAALAALLGGEPPPPPPPLAHDVAVSNISAPASATQGDVVGVSVSVANNGTNAETFDVVLTDTTDAVAIGTQSVSLAAGGSTTVNFNWDTGGATLGDHTLQGQAVLGTDEDTSNNSKTTVVSINSPSTGGTLAVSVRTDKGSYASGSSVFITVNVTDGTNAVADAAVSGEVRNASNTVVFIFSGTSDSAGRVYATYQHQAADGTGNFTANATASKDGFTGGSGSKTFKIR